MIDKLSNLILNLGTSTQENTLLTFSSGQKFMATVVSREGNNYILQWGARLIAAQSHIPLEIGQVMRLQVLSHEGQKVLLRTIPTAVEEKEIRKEDYLKQLIEKYGFSTDKEMTKIETALRKIPVSEGEALRYLVDPHIMLALLFPNNEQKGGYEAIEIWHYGQKAKDKKIFEIHMQMDYKNLGHIQIVLTVVDGYTYVQMWAEQEDTEVLLKERIGILKTATTICQVVPAPAGPLIRKEVRDSIDFTV
ncbi:MAG: hypothetical protein JG781_2546 [Peptococcaceae bacterium]|jgi:hypothetical protein|nr:hypothetical protein [Peptococcaceae bacterium]